MSIAAPVEERDWKYMRSIRGEMLHALCSRINQQAAAIAQSRTGTPHDRYLKLFRHIRDSDRIVAACFDDWRRSNIWSKILLLRREDLLADSQVANFSENGKEWLRKIETLTKM
jgi:hypothetical protein